MGKSKRAESPRSEERENHAKRMNAVLHTIALDCRDPERVLELYYLSKLPDFLEVIRSFAGLPHHPRKLLQYFLTTARPHLVSAEIDEFGRVILSSPDVTDGLVMSRAKK